MKILDKIKSIISHKNNDFTTKPTGSYREIEGNLLDMFDQGKFDIIAHATNCFASMSGGIALQIAQRYPQVSDADFQHYYGYGGDKRLMMGSIVAVGIGNNHIVNLYSQFKPGFQQNYDYKALEKCLWELNIMCKRIKKTNVAFPMIGAGIGGADWNKVSSLIIQKMVDCQVTIVIFKP